MKQFLLLATLVLVGCAHKTPLLQAPMPSAPTTALCYRWSACITNCQGPAQDGPPVYLRARVACQDCNKVRCDDSPALHDYFYGKPSLDPPIGYRFVCPQGYSEAYCFIMPLPSNFPPHYAKEHS